MSELLLQQKRLLSEALSLIPLDGITPEMLRKASISAGFEEHYERTLFADIHDFALFMAKNWDEETKQLLANIPMHELKVRERIFKAIETKLILAAPHKESYKRLHRYLIHPCHIKDGTTLTWQSCDMIWHTAKDNSTDYNYYTKRALLFGVYTSTFLYWYNNQDESLDSTLVFLRHRIENVLSVGKFISSIVSR